VIDRLRAHGVQVEAVAVPIAVGGEAFRVEAVDAAAEPFQGRIEKLLHGAWRPDTVTLERGAARVPLDQPLGRLAVHLLEPRAEDGFANWGILDPWIVPGGDYPIVRGPCGARSLGRVGAPAAPAARPRAPSTSEHALRRRLAEVVARGHDVAVRP